ncbi:MAG: helix-turn-helix domain-containing protein [Verrucomicrobia bacterium]|nr:helix-turn-helix domain-containing protein [Verrucomicrobiota bacterium]
MSDNDRSSQTNRKLLAEISEKSLSPDRQAYSVKEVADMLGVTSKSVYRLLDRNLLRSLQAVRPHRIPRKELERFLQENL